MPKEKFLLVSLKEEESKHLAQIISNDTSRKILDYLAEKDATESELTEKLGIPISTVHYNLQALLKGKLVEAEEFHYSSKGKEVLHYKLANKYIIIAPKSTFGIREKLRRILPAFLLAILGSAGIYIIEKMQSLSTTLGEGAIQASKMAADVQEESIAMAAQLPPQPQVFVIDPALWFLIGCIFTLLVIIIIEFIIYKRKN